jgi:uncharacterized protein with HEPN domain
MEHRIDNQTPNIPLDKNSLQEFKEIFRYTKIITDLVSGMNQNELVNILKGTGLPKDMALQHALLFCLKAIGTCIDNATARLGLNIEQMPLFCQNMFYLRNSLIHHCPTISLANDQFDLLASVCTKMGHIYKYFSKVVDAQNTAINLGGERYKVFLDIHELNFKLREQYPREQRTQIIQEQYLKVILAAIKGLEIETTGTDLTEEGMKQLPHKKFFALQNLLELIATLANPNPEQRLLSEHTRDVINHAHPDADTWLRTLGMSRMEAMHRTGMISNRNLAIHISEMMRLKNEVLLNVNFQRTLGITLTPSPPQPKQSTAKMMQSMSESFIKSTEDSSLVSNVSGPTTVPVNRSGQGESTITPHLPPSPLNVGRGALVNTPNPLPPTQPSTGRGRGWASVAATPGLGRGRGAIQPPPDTPEPKNNNPPGFGRGRGK